MNLLKKSISIIVASLMVTAVFLSTSASAATNKYLGTYNKGNARPSGTYTIQTDTTGTNKPAIKILEYANAAGTSVVTPQNSVYYCIKGGQGFGSTTGTSGNVVNYTRSYNYKNKSTLPAVTIPSDTATYNKVGWILENIIDPSNATERANLYAKIKAFDGKYDVADSDFLTDRSMTEQQLVDVIESFQQAAIWYFTNPSDAFHPSVPSGTDRPNLYVGSGSSSARDVTDVFSTGEGGGIVPDGDSDPFGAFFYYLVNGANAAVASGYTVENSSVSASVSFDRTRAAVTESGSNYLVGPFKVIATGTPVTGYWFTSAKVLAGTTEVTNVTLVGADKTTAIAGANTQAKIENSVNNDFYIVLPKSTSASEVSIELQGSYSEKTLTLWTVDNFATEQPVVEVRPNITPFDYKHTVVLANSEFDLALRKFITKINGESLTTSREPQLTQAELRKLATGTSSLDGGKTAIKTHTKDPVSIKTGDKVIYTIRIYNEGQVAGEATEITDFLPEGLKFVPASESAINTAYGWEVDSTGRVVTTDYLKNRTLNAFDKAPASGTYSIDYADVQIECEVIATTTSTDNYLKNVAEITGSHNDEGLEDRDSTANNLTDNQKQDYNPGTSTQGKGYEDDDDYENLLLPGKFFDLALRKFIVKVNNKEYKTNGVWDRAPVVDVTPLNNGTSTTADYKHTKSPVSVEAGNIVTYAIRVYNEGVVDGYVDEIVDHLPEELEFINNDFNASYGWVLESSDSTERTVKTTKLSKANDVENILKGYDKTTMSTLDYKEIYIQCKVKATAPTKKYITNIADITRYENAAGLADRDNERTVVIPEDSKLPDYKGNTSNKDDLTDKNYHYKGQEDDDDFEKIILEKFDLALRKFITGVNDEKITNRIPEVDVSKFGKTVDNKEVTTADYKHTKDPVRVAQNDLVTYTIRVYNEGTQDGYAAVVKDDVPDGLVFVPGSAVNKEYRWVMYDKDGNATEDANKAAFIKTDYLSKEQEKEAKGNLIKKFDITTMDTPDYKDLKVVFKVSEPNTSDRIIINKAEISRHTDSEGNEVTDIDSTPDKWIDGEDDQDIEKIYVKYFDLALRKWVTTAIVIEDGVQKEMDTGHYAEQDPEPIVKVEVNNKRIQDTIIKFRYRIRITNEGEIAGYAKEISDYIPEGLKFNQADNPEWKEADGKVTTDALKDTLLEPGEAAYVDIILTWINGENNMGVKTNIAEISKDYNDSHTPDIDSTPNNKKEGEDDIDDAPVALMVVSGSEPTYIALIGGALLIVTGGVLLIKKYVI